MVNILYGLLSGLLAIAVPLVKKVLLALGIGAVTYSGLYYLINQLTNLFQQQLAGMPVDALAILGMMKIDIAFTMIISAITAKAILSGWSKSNDQKTSSYSHL